RTGSPSPVFATGQTILEVASHAPDPLGNFLQISVVALQMQTSQKVRVTGKVLACDVSSPVRCDPKSHPGLPGAMVSLRPRTIALSGGLKGVIDRGGMFTLSNRDGSYSMVVPNSSLIE